MPVKPADVIASARKLIGTPYQHQGRIPGQACDCIGLAILVCQDLNLGDFDFKDYGRNPNGELLREIEKVCTPIDLMEGCLAVFAMRNLPQHCAIIAFDSGWKMIHAYQNARAVKEHDCIEWWDRKVVGFYALPNVDYSDAVREF